MLPILTTLYSELVYISTVFDDTDSHHLAVVHSEEHVEKTCNMHRAIDYIDVC